jgi:hypothetical protein
MKHFEVTIIQDRGSPYWTVKYNADFSGAKAAVAAYAIACRAAMLEPGPQTVLRNWCRDTPLNGKCSSCNNLRTVTIELKRVA